MRSRLLVVASLLALLAPTAALMLPALAQPGSPARSPAAPCMLLDPSLAADASAVLAPAAESGLAVWDSHTLAHLWEDEIHTTIYAALGLVGAYVTQGTEAFVRTPTDDDDTWEEEQRSSGPLRQLRKRDADNDSFSQ